MNKANEQERRELERALAPVARQAERLGIAWLLIGAAARDLIMAETLDQAATRATFDVDIAVCVADWSEFDALKDALVREEGAVVDKTFRQRVLLSSGTDRTPLDIVPFGEVATDGLLTWQPEGDPVLNVHGLEEAQECSSAVELPGGLRVQVPTLEGYLCLKLLAWNDRRDSKPRHDSIDIKDVLNHADELIPLDELYSAHAQTMERYGSDSNLACIEILGGRILKSTQPRTRELLVEMLTKQVDEEGRLALIKELGDARQWLPRLRALRNGLIAQ